MGSAHAKAAEVVDIRPFGIEFLSRPTTTTLIKTGDVEVIRLVLPSGRRMAPRELRGPVTLQCLEGAVELTALGRSHIVRAGQLIHVEGEDRLLLRAILDSSLLLTIQLAAAARRFETEEAPAERFSDCCHSAFSFA